MMSQEKEPPGMYFKELLSETLKRKEVKIRAE